MSEPKVFGRECVRLLLESGLAVALAATIGLLPTTAAAQALYGSMTGTIADGTPAADGLRARLTLGLARHGMNR